MNHAYKMCGNDAYPSPANTCQDAKMKNNKVSFGHPCPKCNLLHAGKLYYTASSESMFVRVISSKNPSPLLKEHRSYENNSILMNEDEGPSKHQ